MQGTLAHLSSNNNNPTGRSRQAWSNKMDERLLAHAVCRALRHSISGMWQTNSDTEARVDFIFYATKDIQLL